MINSNRYENYRNIVVEWHCLKAVKGS